MSAPETSAELLTNNFLEIPISSTENHCYAKIGFIPYLSLQQVFENIYTYCSSDVPQVRALKADDIRAIVGKEWNTYDKKYNKLFKIGAEYMLANHKANYYTYYINATGNFFDDGYIYYSVGVRPIVSLVNSIKTDGFDYDGIWNIQL